jgi:ATP-dependent exoDNAse (exonuclease V) beta subunit
MSDLVKRLRDIYVVGTASPIFSESADEIERLERENAALTKECIELRSWTRAREDEIHARHQRDMDAMKKLCAEFQAENAALKVALSDEARLKEMGLAHESELLLQIKALKAENSKLRSALEIVHFKPEPWQ